MNWLPNKLRVLLQFQRGMLVQYGWLRAWWRDKPVDRNGEPLPWITYPTIDFLSQFDFSQSSVFEWGAGYSTLWWQKRALSVVSVETNEEWARILEPEIIDKVKLWRTPYRSEMEGEISILDNYGPQKFDVIVIDNGPQRWRCAEIATKFLSEGGLILLDNSDQCLQACAVLRDAGLTQIDFTGFAPGMGYAQTTSIFFRCKLKFPLLGHQPRQSVAQPNPPWPNS